MNFKLLAILIAYLSSFYLVFSMNTTTSNELLLEGIKKQNSESIQKAIADEADVNRLSIDRYNPGYSAFHIAIMEENLDIVKLLIHLGADISLKDQRFVDGNHNAKELVLSLIQTYFGSRKKLENYTKILEFIENWEEQLKREIKNEIDPYLPPVLGDIVADYVV